MKRTVTPQVSHRSPIEVARELRRWMQRTGTTQRAIAAELGITQPHVSQILAGQFGW
ncbi:MAG: helix-turn-helix domain-containing protein, partial [Gemmatimonadales bacterium]